MGNLPRSRPRCGSPPPSRGGGEGLGTARWRSQHHRHHWVRNELAIEAVELLARRRMDRRGHREVIAGTGRAHLERGRVEVGRVLADDLDDRLREAVARTAHDLDRERAWKLEKAHLRDDGCGSRTGAHGRLRPERLPATIDRIWGRA